MKTSIKLVLFLIIYLLTTTLFAGNKPLSADKDTKAREWLKNKSLSFIENKGQIANSEGKVADNVLFKTTFGNCDIYITTEGLSYVFIKTEDRKRKTEDRRPDTEDSLKVKGRSRKFEETELAKNHKVSYYRMDMKLIGARIDKDSIIKEQPGKQGHYNYFYAHCPEGIYDVQEYGKITIKNIYKGIDWVIYSNPGSKEHPLKYDFVVHPQSDYKDIKIKFINAQSTSLTDNNSKLKIETIAGTIEEGKLYSYQDSIKAEINSSYLIDKDTVVSFKIADYDISKTLIIDPLVWATYYGSYGVYEAFTSVSTDSHDNVFICGYSASLIFPLQYLSGAFYQDSNVSWQDAVILKFNKYGVRLWATYYGGDHEDEATTLGIDSQDNIYISGYTESTDFPVQQMSGAFYQDSLKTSLQSHQDAFILKFNNQGQRLWATYYGGTNDEREITLCIDHQDNVNIVGITRSSDFPTQQLANAYWQATNSSNFWIMFILKFNNNGQRLWSTYYGGDSGEKDPKVCIDRYNNLYITGGTGSYNFPVQQLSNAYWQPNNAGDDVFIIKFNNLGVRQWATYYGGIGVESANSINVDSQDNIYIVGQTWSTDFPVDYLPGAYWQQTNVSFGHDDVFILKFNNQGQRKWATYYGGSSTDWYPYSCIDKQDNLYITGVSYSVNFPTQQMLGEYWQPSFNTVCGIFILKFNKYGARKCATFYGSEGGADASKAIITDKKNAVYIVGKLTGLNAFSVNYGNGAYYDSTSDGIEDCMILKFGICHAEPSDSAKSGRNNFCANDNGSIKLIAFGGSGDSLKWYRGACRQNYIGSGDTLVIPSPSITTTYYACWVSCDTAYSPCVSVTVNVDTSTTQPPALVKTDKNNYCANDISMINLTATGGIGDTLKWYAGSCGQNYLGNGDTLIIPSPAVSTSYYARWESRCDTSACASVTINVKPMPNVNLGNDAFICEGQTIELKANPAYSSYLWQDGSTNYNFMVSQLGLYWVTVNYNNCFASDTIQFLLCEPPLNIWIPNAFTPNGDGKNDIFRIESINTMKDFHLYIFNRWGQIIFETDDINHGWDGKCKGNEVQQGVYQWKIDYSWLGSSGESIKEEKTGRLTLIK